MGALVPIVSLSATTAERSVSRLNAAGLATFVHYFIVDPFLAVTFRINLGFRGGHGQCDGDDFG